MEVRNEDCEFILHLAGSGSSFYTRGIEKAEDQIDVCAYLVGS